jgi:predicted nucleic acid-binding protein
MPEKIISNTSSLIALERINLLPLLCRIYSEVIVSEAVKEEFGNIPLHCLSIRQVQSNFLKLLVIDLNLGKGEAETIALATQAGLGVIIDDSKARRVAEDMGLKVTGTIGILIKAEKLGLIESAHDKARELRDRGFYVSEELLGDLLGYKKKA